MGKRKYGPPEGKWKKHDGGGRYRVWEGTGAHALRELEPPPQEEAAQPDAPAPAAAMTVRFSSEQPLGGDVRLPTGWIPGFAGLPRADDDGGDPPILLDI
ncbi:hypothetical protein CYMTET_16400 [Cymbomonas tetramitiformis]|uniref:Uncharacterized protein n=1 Tax=Cymbomonas tetramitiformis TaxID=36881 RepID=A0AAE0GC74_9CHLO|nr:hypothetical protein CYMTET_16400 [Cymbomonas tetramitiformis]